MSRAGSGKIAILLTMGDCRKDPYPTTDDISEFRSGGVGLGGGGGGRLELEFQVHGFFLGLSHHV